MGVLNFFKDVLVKAPKTPGIEELINLLPYNWQP